MADAAPDYAALRERLLADREQWSRRLEAIQRDRRRQSQSLERDWEEQATQRQNDETLDGLDVAGRRELQSIDAALARMEAGTYGSCARCGEAIQHARLEALPTAVTCTGCAGAQR